MMTDDLVSRIQALYERATKGPWKESNDGYSAIDDCNGNVLYYDEVTVTIENNQLIVALVNAFPALLSELRALREDAERFRWAIDTARWIRHEHEVYVAIPVALDADLSCVALRIEAIDAARRKP